MDGVLPVVALQAESPLVGGVCRPMHRGEEVLVRGLLDVLRGGPVTVLALVALEVGRLLGRDPARLVGEAGRVAGDALGVELADAPRILGVMHQRLEGVRMGRAQPLVVGVRVARLARLGPRIRRPAGRRGVDHPRIILDDAEILEVALHRLVDEDAHRVGVAQSLRPERDLLDSGSAGHPSPCRWRAGRRRRRISPAGRPGSTWLAPLLIGSAGLSGSENGRGRDDDLEPRELLAESLRQSRGGPGPSGSGCRTRPPASRGRPARASAGGLISSSARSVSFSALYQSGSTTAVTPTL